CWKSTPYVCKISEYLFSVIHLQDFLKNSVQQVCRKPHYSVKTAFYLIYFRHSQPLLDAIASGFVHRLAAVNICCSFLSLNGVKIYICHINLSGSVLCAAYRNSCVYPMHFSGQTSQHCNSLLPVLRFPQNLTVQYHYSVGSNEDFIFADCLEAVCLQFRQVTRHLISR